MIPDDSLGYAVAWGDCSKYLGSTSISIYKVKVRVEDYVHCAAGSVILWLPVGQVKLPSPSWTVHDLQNCFDRMYRTTFKVELVITEKLHRVIVQDHDGTKHQ